MFGVDLDSEDFVTYYVAPFKYEEGEDEDGNKVTVAVPTDAKIYAPKDCSHFFDGYDYVNNIQSTTTFSLDNFYTEGVETMSDMFAGCISFETFSLGEGWDTSNVTNMDGMLQEFGSCNNVVLDCSDWNVDKVTSHNEFVVSNSSSNITQPNWKY